MDKGRRRRFGICLGPGDNLPPGAGKITAIRDQAPSTPEKTPR